MSLPKAPVRTGGLCSIRFCKHQDIIAYPPVDPLTGIISSAISLKEGASLYYAEAVDPARSFEELQRDSSAGPFFEINVKATLRGSNTANLLSLHSMILPQWVVLVEDRNGTTRLLGNIDSGASLVYGYNSGTVTASRKTEITFKWQHPMPAAVYSGESFDISIGGITLTTGCITFLKRFRVGAAGAPMADADTLYVNNALIGKEIFVLSDGIKLPLDDGSADIDWTGSFNRRVQKAIGSNTIEFIGGVVQDEIIEIYAFN